MSRPDPLSFRAATTSDAERLGRAVVEALEDYRSFAPPGWAPPSLPAEVEHLRELFGDPDVWCIVAETGGLLAGQVTVMPAARAGRPEDDPALAHLSNLFVDRDLWGSGVARALHAAAIEAAREGGFADIRLFVAAAHGRARRFYEREGWVAVSGEFHDPVPGLVLVEYRYGLDE